MRCIMARLPIILKYTIVFGKKEEQDALVESWIIDPEKFKSLESENTKHVGAPVINFWPLERRSLSLFRIQISRNVHLWYCINGTLRIQLHTTTCSRCPLYFFFLRAQTIRPRTYTPSIFPFTCDALIVAAGKLPINHLPVENIVHFLTGLMRSEPQITKVNIG